MRTLNFICLALTGFVCLSLYNLAEETRVAQVELRATKIAAQRERQKITILQAEWASVTKPSRIHALSERHLSLLDKPALRLASFSQLPSKDLPPIVPEDRVRTAKQPLPGMVVPKTNAFALLSQMERR